MRKFLTVEKLSFTYDNSITPLFEAVSFQIEEGWTGIVGANGSGKTTLLKLVCGLLRPDMGSIKSPGKAFYSEQRTDSQPGELDSFFKSTLKQTYRIKESLQMKDDWQSRWDVLSHGERKRCQIAAALFEEPAVLAVDEPSNHLDNRSRQFLLEALKAYRGIGLLVSHDRDLMDALCQRTIFVDPPRIEVRKCGYSLAVQEIEKDNEASKNEYLLAKREFKKLKRRVHQQKEKAGRADKLRSKRDLNPRDHDAKSKRDLARLTGKDSVDGRIHKRLKTQLMQAQSHQSAIHFKKDQALGIEFNAEEAGRFFPVIIPSGYLPLGKDRCIRFPELTIQYGDKIGLAGDNGAGKSTFAAHLVAEAGLPGERLIYIPQEIPVEQSRHILERIQRYEGDKKGRMMSIVSRLGSDPDHVLQTPVPTPGEVRKLLLAEGLMLNPAVIVMDEPTNHMDLTSIACVEEALTACGCAQLLVSHDVRFLKNTVNETWFFSRQSETGYTVIRQYAI